MPYSLVWLPSVLEAEGLKVAVVPGWEDRGHGDVGRIFGVICHHTATQRSGNYPSMKTIINGREDLAGPLSQLGLGRDGTFYVIAAGRCNHSGKGIWQGLVNGNSNFIGIEAENTGLGTDYPWPDVQMQAYQRGVAAILNHIKQPAHFCAGHREYALPIGRKPDPSFDMIEFRTKVQEYMEHKIPVTLIPAEEQQPVPGRAAPRPTLRRGGIGNNDEDIKYVQLRIKVTVDGNYGPKTEAAVRRFQLEKALVPDGIVGPKTWITLDLVQV